MSESDAVAFYYLSKRAELLENTELDDDFDKNVLVYDMGAGTLDITYFTRKECGDKYEIEMVGKMGVSRAGNYMDYILRRDYGGGTGNANWSGFLYVCIRGGQQDTTETHLGENLLLFNPACEFATAEVCLDIDLVMAYYALISVNRDVLGEQKQNVYDKIIRDVRQVLSESNYDSPSYTGNLLDYCDNHPSVKMVPGQLTDPIQVEPIHIEDFAIDNKEDSRNLDFTHDEAVNKGKYYWDKAKQCVLTPARPTNVFWSKHLSNMMQQNFSLSEYFEHEREIVERRAQLLR